jgi:hypothetical protein
MKNLGLSFFFEGRPPDMGKFEIRESCSKEWKIGKLKIGKFTWC